MRSLAVRIPARRSTSRKVGGEPRGGGGWPGPSRSGSAPRTDHARSYVRTTQGLPTMILPKVRDPRLVTIRRGGTLTDSDHHLLALWAASCAEHVLHLFESVHPEDPRPRQAIEHARAWVRGEVRMMESRAAGGHAMAAARDKEGQHGTPRTQLAKLAPRPTSPPTSSVRLPTRSRPRVRPLRQASPRPRVDLSAGGSVTCSRRRFASSCSTTSDCGTTFADRSSTAERAPGVTALAATPVIR
jgi:hypothetical protein